MINIRSNTPISLNVAEKYIPSIFSTRASDDRSDKYCYIPTYELVEQMNKEGFQIFAMSAPSSRLPAKKEFGKHLIRFRHENAGDISVGDEVFEVCLINSHDGSSGVSVLAGMFRLVCSNGLVLSNGFSNSISVRHQNITIDGILENATKMVENSNSIYELKNHWQGIELDYEKKYALASAAHEMKFDDRPTPVKPIDFLEVRRPEDNKNDLWTVFNVVQENLINGGIRGFNSRRRIRTRPIRNVYQNINFNQRLWEKASELAIAA